MAGSEGTPGHWLWRLDAADWIASARREVEHGQRREDARRAAVTHARRAGGMALNGVLVALGGRPELGWDRPRCETAWGRSYIDHLRRVAASDPSAEQSELDPSLAALLAELAEPARELLGISVMPPQGMVALSQLSRRRDPAAGEALDRARAIVEACARFALPDGPA
ncbi:hypothetical protein PPSIR1_02863 [Plesiocystis pacifica SIR-1]|uniref:Uncharacterized protein n=1 Tax=Plesiocystis pacifica SIR-1 TaxID=391625 RepID=A6G943_9BACT|nr:hypothetical protein [Plesiocystis pacifica]EDM77591.1 hypothetical protein PPSIR1_02863 [Plesiocystis pacifica SIR-1]